MAEKDLEEDGAIHGLSVVDDSVNETLRVEDACKSEDDSLVVKLDDEADVVVDHDVCEEVEESFLEETEEKINLRDVLIEKNSERDSKYTCQNSTLIITTEEHLDTTCDNTVTETVEDESKPMNQPANAEATTEDSKKAPKKIKAKVEDHCYFWVSNISRHVKATDLKKLFSPMGKVTTAKILTNGKSNFGYVSMESAEMVEKCIKHLDNIPFDGKRIIVSKDRPDLRESKQVKLEARRKKSHKLESKKEAKAVESKLPEGKKIILSDEEDEDSDVIVELKKKLEALKAEVSRYKWKMIEYQRRHDGMRKKCDSLEKELKDVQFKMRNDRRRLNQDRDQFEKTKKMDLIRIEADKVAVNKELVEVKKLREHLKAKIEEIKVQPKKNLKRRSTRTPPPIDRSRSSRGRSPPLRAGPRAGYRPDERLEKKRKRDESLRGRTPPPPPKLSNGMGKKRSDNISHREFFDQLEKRSLPLDHGHGYEYRHKTTFPPPQEVSRPPWSTPYPKDPRRMSAASSGGQNYPGDPMRYGGGYQFPTSSIPVAPRSYYPEFSKPYGHY